MKRAVLAVALVVSSVASVALAADPPGGMRLLEGYVHKPLQGIDSVVGEIKKEGGLRIMYDIGRITPPGGLAIGGGFTNWAKQTRPDQQRFYREQTVQGQPLNLAWRKDNSLVATYPEKGINFSTTVKTPEEMAEALLMILTFPAAKAEPGAKAGAK